MRFDDVAALWREGQRRLAEADPADKPALERVTDEIVLELRRRLGGPFTHPGARGPVRAAGHRLVL